MSFTIEDYDLRNSFKTERTLLTLSGFYPRRGKKLSVLYTISVIFNLFESFGHLFSMLVQMVLDRKDLPKLTETLLFFMTHFTFLCKLTNFVYYREKMLNIENTLTESIFYGYLQERLDLIKARVESCQLVAKIFRILCVLGVVFYVLVPLLGEKDGRVLPLPGWFPYETHEYCYYPTFAFQVMSVIVSAYNNSSIDIMTCMLITITCGQLEVLKENLKDINYRIDGGQSVEMITAKFNHNVKHHMAIVGLAHKIEAMFSKGIFLQFFASVVVICLTGFQMTVVPIPSIQFIRSIVYLSCMVCQIAMYCWYGNDITTTSDSIGQYFYMSNWYEADLKIRKNMIIFLERTKTPVVLTAGKFVTLSLATLTSILRSSYSYFAVLQRLYSEDN